MHDFSFFLLKNWLPVGLAAIVFFVIGLLLAKFIWGRYSTRLSNAVEENLNLAGQWSALGASQRDLFKKLRSRWQADRESWEFAISAKEAQIKDLTAQLQSSGKTVVLDSEEGAEAKARVMELEALLEAKDAKISELAAELEVQENNEVDTKAMTVPVSPVLAASANSSDTDALQQKIKDLEQDLIDTHDELHDVREGYRKQVELVESLELKLIEAPEEPGAQESGGEAAALSSRLHAEAKKGAQFAALFSQRGRELNAIRQSGGGGRAAQEKLTRLVKEHGEQMDVLKSGNAEVVENLNAEISRLSETLENRGETVEKLEKELKERNSELESQVERLAGLQDLERRKASLQAELNDACHEMYDVRSALKERLEEIEILEARLDELDVLEEEHESTKQELTDTRHELSDVRLALNEKTEALSKAEAGMEELEAIIEDRGAEVNDLSTEVRQQRDLVRQLKNTLAEQEGELDALNEESSEVHSVIKAKTTLLEEHQLRIKDLEKALADRYKEMNLVRVESSDHAFAAKYHESRADQLEAELERRVAIFDESDRRVASAEEALAEATEKIGELTGLLAASEASIQELKAELEAVSNEKDQKIRDLETAASRVNVLEEAAREREEKLSLIEFDLQTSRSEASDFSSRLARITTEIEEARQEQKLSEGQVVELEEALRESDARTLQLSADLERKEEELESVSSELNEIKEALATQESAAAEAEIRIESLKTELEAKIESLAEENKELSRSTESTEEIDQLKGEIETLRKSLENYSRQRDESVSEIDQLRDKVARRGDSIRELKGQLSDIMMQRSSRDDEISLLKDKLKAVEAELKASDASAKQSLQASTPSVSGSIDLEEAIKSSLSLERRNEAGTSLDDLGEKHGHHTSPQEVEPAPQGKEPAPSASDPRLSAMNERREQEDDSAVYFDESTAKLSDTELEKIDHCARLARRSRGKLAVTVIGFAGAEGSADFNESLSARRAEAVRERLLERGVTQSNVHVRNAGQDRKFNDWKARRVELVVAPKAVAETVN